jgi:hypothetical protein
MNLTYDVTFYVAISFFVGSHGTHSLSFLWQVRLAGNSSVTKDIEKPGDYGDHPGRHSVSLPHLQLARHSVFLPCL